MMNIRFTRKSMIISFVAILLLVGLLFVALYAARGNVLSPNNAVSESGLELNEILVKVLLKEGERFNKPIQITNTGSSFESVQVVVDDLEGLLVLEDDSFTLQPGQTRTMNFEFSTRFTDYNFEPGVYVGNVKFQTDGLEEVLPIIIEVESLDVDFDVNLDFSVNDRVVLLGGTALADINVYNFGGLDRAVVDMQYIVADLNGNRLISENENLVVESQASVSKTISIPENFEEGKYIFYVVASYGDSVGTASYLFDVGEIVVEEGSGIMCSITDPLCWIAFVILIILIFIVFLIILNYLFSLLTWFREYKSPVRQRVVERVVTKKVKKDGLFHSLGLYLAKRKEQKARLRRERDKLELEKLRIKERDKRKEERYRLELERLKSKKKGSFFGSIFDKIKKNKKERERVANIKKSANARKLDTERRRESHKRSFVEVIFAKLERSKKEREKRRKEKERVASIKKAARARSLAAEKRRESHKPSFITIIFAKLERSKKEREKRRKEKERVANIKDAVEKRREDGLKRQKESEDRILEVPEGPKKDSVFAVLYKKYEKSKEKSRKRKLVKERRKRFLEEERSKERGLENRRKLQRLKEETEFRRQLELERIRANASKPFFFTKLFNSIDRSLKEAERRRAFRRREKKREEEQAEIETVKQERLLEKQKLIDEEQRKRDEKRLARERAKKTKEEKEKRKDFKKIE